MVWDGKSWEFEEDLISSNSSFRSEFHYSIVMRVREAVCFLVFCLAGWWV